MFSMVVNVGGEQRSILYSQYINYFNCVKLQPPAIKTFSTDDSTLLSDSNLLLKLDVNMDQPIEKFPKATLIDNMPNILLNNPSITVYPARSIPSSSIPASKQNPVSTVNRISGVLAPIPSKSVSGENATLDKLNSKKIDTKETKNDSKRNASPSTPTRPKKIQKLCNTESLKKDCKEKSTHSNNIDEVSDFNQSKPYQIKKTSSSSKYIKTHTATTSTSPNSINRVSVESTSPKLSNKKQPINVDLNCKADSTNINVEKDKSVVSPKLLQNELRKNSQGSSHMLKIKYKDDVYEITDPERIDMVMKTLCSEDRVPSKSDSNTAKSPEYEHKRSSETKDSNSKMKSNIHNKLNSISKNQVTCHAARSRSNQMIRNQQQPCTSKHSQYSTHISSNVKQQVTLTNLSSKLQQPNKQNDLKEHHVSSNQQSASVKHPIAISTQTASVNKQTTSSQLQPNKQQTIGNQHQASPPNKQVVINQQAIPINKQTIGIQLLTPTNKPAISNLTQPSTSKLPLLTVTSVTKQLPAVKSSVACQSLSQDLKKCTKCNVPSEDDTCTTCRMSAHLKGVTVTRIETPGPQLVLNSSPEVSPPTVLPPTVSPPMVSPPTDDCVQVISDDEDTTTVIGINSTLEPVIYKTESQDQIKKHIDKLSLNPKLLEDKLWQKDLSADDYFKFEHCRSINIGSFSTLPASSDDLVICMHGIRMTVKVNNSNPITIDVPIDNIVKMLGFYADQYTTLLIYTNYLASAGIRHLLKMHEDNINNYYNPLSKDKAQKKIMWTLELSKSDVKKLEQFMLRFKDKYKPLTNSQINAILTKTGEGEDKYEADSVNKKEVFENTMLLRGKIDDRTISVLRISDYKMLQIEEFMNDVLMEFYLSWWYVRKLSEKDRSRSYLFNSHFYFKLTNKAASESTSESKAKTRHNRIKKWTRKVDIFKKDFIFIPINETYHWFMAVICFPYLSGPVHFDDGTPVDVSNDKPDRPYHSPIESVNPIADEADGSIEDPWDFDISYSQKSSSDYETDISNLQKENRTPIKQPCILIFDSLNGGVARARIVATLREWLAEEYKSKHGAEKDFSPASMKGAMVKVPQQPNSVDCGLFVCHYFEKFFERPIVDYHCPITHLENWFLSNEVSKNCQKRRQVQNTIQDMIKEQGGLPPSVILPTLNFSHNYNQQQRSSQNHSRYQNRTFYDSHNNDDIEEDIDEDDYVEEEDDDDDHEDYVEDEEDNGVYVEDDDYNYMGDYHSEDEYPENDDEYPVNDDEYPTNDDDIPDQREYFGEMVNDDEWQERPHRHGDSSNYNSEPEYEDGELEQFPIRTNNIVVDVENMHLRNRRNCHVSNDNLQLFRMSNNRHFHRSDHDDNNDNEDYPEEETGEDEMLDEEEVEDHNGSNQLLNSKKHRFNQR